LGGGGDRNHAKVCILKIMIYFINLSAKHLNALNIDE
jgi:hypothetical protein